MSFILDALRRAQREREAGHAPDLASVYRDPDRARRARWPRWLLAAVLLLNAGFLAVFWWSRPGLPPEERTSAAMAPEVPAAPPVPAAPERPAEAPRSYAPVEAGAPGAPGEPPAAAAAPRSEPAVQPSSRPRTASGAREELPRPLAGRSEPEPVAVPPPPVPDAAETEGPQEAAPMAAEAPPAPPVPDREKAPAPPPVVQASIPLLSQLPPDVRARLPNLRIDGHVYGDDPAQRFVFIGSRSYRAGDRIGPDGPVLVEVVPDGAIIDYGGGKARVPIAR